MDCDSFSRDIDRGVLCVILYDGRSTSFRISVMHSFLEFRNRIIEAWDDLRNLSFEIFYMRDRKRCVIDCDGEIQCFVCFTVLQGESFAEVHISVLKGSTSGVYSSECGSISSVSAGNVTNEIEVQQPLNVSVWANAIIGVGQRFPGGAEEFRLKLKQYCLETGFKAKYVKNDSKRITVVCSKKEETGCLWRVHASEKFNLPSYFIIKSMISEHTCGIGLKDMNKPAVSSKLVKDVVLSLVRDRPNVKPSEIIDLFRREHGVKLGYYYAYTGKEMAVKEIHGDEALSYHELSFYVESLRTSNPGSHVVLEVNGESRRFERCFIAFEACIYGFMHCRPMICLDGTFLKAKYKGCMLAATAKNGDEGIFPLAFAVVDSENDSNWLWFLENLKIILPCDKVYTFISDRHNGLVSSIPKVFPNSTHGYCLWHLRNNLSSVLSGKNPKRGFILKLFTDLAYAPTHEEFQKNYKEFREIAGPCAFDFVSSLKFEHWANAYFSSKRYGEMSSNISESFNSWILKERNMPIKTMIDEIRIKIMNLMSDRRDVSRTWSTILCPTMEKKLQQKVQNSRSFKVVKSNDVIFEVEDSKKYSVNLYRSYCSCNLWSIEGFPCEHAVISILASGNSVYSFIDPCYYSAAFRESYSHSIQPVPSFICPRVKDDELRILPPETKRAPGRPRKNRIESTGVNPKKLRKCGRCNCYVTHNKKTCSAKINE